MKLERSIWWKSLTFSEVLITCLLVFPPLASLYVAGLYAVASTIPILRHSARLYLLDSGSLIALVVLIVAFLLATIGTVASLAFKTNTWNNLKAWLRPTKPMVITFIFVYLLSLMVITDRYATTKVTWDQLRGIPFPFLTLYELRLPPTASISFGAINPGPMLVDLIWMYLVTVSFTNLLRTITNHIAIHPS